MDTATAEREATDLALVAPALADDPAVVAAIARIVANRPPLPEGAVRLLRSLGCPSLN